MTESLSARQLSFLFNLVSLVTTEGEIIRSFFKRGLLLSKLTAPLKLRCPLDASL